MSLRASMGQSFQADLFQIQVQILTRVSQLWGRGKHPAPGDPFPHLFHEGGSTFQHGSLRIKGHKQVRSSTDSGSQEVRFAVTAKLSSTDPNAWQVHNNSEVLVSFLPHVVRTSPRNSQACPANNLLSDPGQLKGPL